MGEAFTLLTTAPGADVAPYHHRQIVVLTQADWPRRPSCRRPCLPGV